MVPWPVAVLTIFYGLIAAISSATMWQIESGVIDRPLMWPAAWLAVSASVMLGLPLLKPWARTLAIVASAVMVLTTLAVAASLVSRGRPVAGLLATASSGVHVVIIRYLQRPSVKAFFCERGAA